MKSQLQVPLVFRLRKEAPLVYWALRIVVVMTPKITMKVICGVYVMNGNLCSLEHRNIDGLVITKWGQCDICSHWTHLAYCSPVRVLRLNEEFRCPHCAD